MVRLHEQQRAVSMERRHSLLHQSALQGQAQYRWGTGKQINLVLPMKVGVPDAKNEVPRDEYSAMRHVTSHGIFLTRHRSQRQILFVPVFCVPDSDVTNHRATINTHRRACDSECSGGHSREAPACSSIVVNAAMVQYIVAAAARAGLLVFSILFKWP